jgi:hypothetical protein
VLLLALIPTLTASQRKDECKVIAHAWPRFEAMRDGSRKRKGLEGKRRAFHNYIERCESGSLARALTLSNT